MKNDLPAQMRDTFLRAFDFEQFTTEVGRMFASVPFDELAAMIGAVGKTPKAKSTTSTTSSKRFRTSTEEVAKQKQAALAAVSSFGNNGASKGDVMKKTGSKVDLGRALQLLAHEGKLRKTGDRRLTRYFVKLGSVPGTVKTMKKGKGKKS